MQVVFLQESWTSIKCIYNNIKLQYNKYKVVKIVEES